MASKESPPTPPQRTSKSHKRHSHKKTTTSTPVVQSETAIVSTSGRETCKVTHSPTVNPPPTLIDTTPSHQHHGRRKKSAASSTVTTAHTSSVQLEFVNEIQTQAHEIHIIDENAAKKNGAHGCRSNKSSHHFDVPPGALTYLSTKNDRDLHPHSCAGDKQVELQEPANFSPDEPKIQKHHKRKKSEARENKSIYRKLLNRIKLIVDRTDNTDKNSDTDELPIPERYYPESLTALSKATKFTQQEIKRIYRGFKAECPTGMVGEDTFKDIYSQFFPLGASSGQYAHYVFQSIDIDRSGTLSFEEFLINLSILSRGSLEEKLEWTFSLYDINGDGCITREEMTHIITSVYELMGRVPDGCPETEQIKEKVDHIFRRMDRNCDGIITLEEFVECCRNDVTICDAIAAFDTAF